MEFKDEGNKLFKQGKWESAAVMYAKAVENDPTLSAAYSNKAACSIHLKLWETGNSDCNKALESIAKGSLPSLETKVYWRKAVCLRHLHKDRQEWEETVKLGLQLDPKNEKLLEESMYIFTEIKNGAKNTETQSAPLSKEGSTASKDEISTSINSQNLTSVSHNSPTNSTVKSTKFIYPDLPLTYTGLLSLIRSTSPDVYNFWYTKVTKRDLMNALSKAGVEPQTLDYLYEMISANPGNERNSEFLEAVESSPRFTIAQFIANQELYKQALECTSRK